MQMNDYQVLIKRLCLSFGLFTLSRLGFYFYNLDYFQAASVTETLWAFVVGLRFDLSTTLIANLFFILFSLVPYRSKFYGKFLKTVFVLGNFVFLSFIVGDYEYFSFNGKKLTYDLFLTSGDIQDQSLQLIFNHWYLSLLSIGFGIVSWFYYPERKSSGKKMKWLKALPISLLVFILTGIGVRGGLQLRSLSPKQAFTFKTYELGNFALNSVYSLVRSFGKEGAPASKFFSSDEKAFQTLYKKRSFDQSELGIKDQNVVIIIVESLSQEYVDEGFTPFLSKLGEKGIYFKKNFANGRRSIEALPSIMTSFPSIIGTPIYQSQYQSNQFYPLPRALKSEGYSTSFFHGGKRGTMDFDAYCYSIGFEKYFALEDYPDQSHYDGHWGVYDHHYLNYVVDELDKHKEPFFSGIFTLSSHQPYSIPHELQGKFPKGSLPIHESIGYADYALSQFFEKAKDRPWFNNTLFVITADHTQKLKSKKYQSLLGRYRVPLMFFHPSFDFKSVSNDKITQHADILPSVLDFLNIDHEKRLYFGSSVFNKDEGRMINFNSGGHFLLSNNALVLFDGSSPKYFSVSEDLLGLEPSKDDSPDLLEELKALIQYTNNGLRGNNIYNFQEQ
tara:strand:+ start:1038 stop:2882 length:1845 start_codon:yes stop_codon:yes gene_type:complete